MKLKIETRIYSATIARDVDGANQVVLAQLMEVLPEVVRIPEDTNLGPHVKTLSQWNEGKKKLKLSFNNPGDSFTIQQKYIVKDEEGQEDTIAT